MSKKPDEITGGASQAMIEPSPENESNKVFSKISSFKIHHSNEYSQTWQQNGTIPLWEQAQGQWLSILSALAHPLTSSMAKVGRHGPCPVHGGKNGFRLFKNVDHTGGGVCNTCGYFSSGFKLLAWVNGWSREQTKDAVRAYLSPYHPSTVLPRVRVIPPQPFVSCKPVDYAYQQRRTQAVLAQCVPLSHPQAEPVRAYLIQRGLGAILLNELPDGVRCHPSLAYWDGGILTGHFPAMVAPVVNQAGELVALHRTYLTHDGAKAPVPAAKKLTPPCRADGLKQGSAIPLYALQGDILAVGEGIETMLAVRLATGLPVYSCVNAGLLAVFTPPSTVKQLMVMADLDKSQTGQQIGERLVRRLVAQGFDARIILPKTPLADGLKSIDWLDVLRQWQHNTVKGGVH